MLSAFLRLKRNFFAITEDYNEHGRYTTTESSEACASRKRLRVDEPGSINDTQSPCTTDVLEREIIAQETKKQELRARLKELQETNFRIKKEAEHDNARFQELQGENMVCIACKETIQNPQTLSCGHSACYSCLRQWWTQPPAQPDGAEMIDTDAESDLGEQGGARDEHNGDAELAPAPAPRTHRRHQFTSAVNRKKHCPYCKDAITRRPAPNYRLRNINGTLKSDLTPPKEARSAHRRRDDIWHGIFHPENGHPDPDYFMQAQRWREAEEIVARRERERLQAFEEGRMRGVLETRAQWERAQEARRAAMARPEHELGFWRGNPPVAHRAPLVVVAIPAAAAPNPQAPDAHARVILPAPPQDPPPT